jgi:DNA-binding NarL/FixJ family response regulator
MLLRLLLVDDSDFVRAGLRSIFASRSDWQICGEAADGVTAIAKVQELAPDVVILDMTMPVMNGFEAAKEIRRHAPSTKIILFSVHDAPADDLPVDAFVSGSCGADGLILAIERLTASVAQKPKARSTRA